MNSTNITNSNLEFRKIPSLRFLYEINSNGTILRNVKSKKQIKINLSFHHTKTGYYESFIRNRDGDGHPRRVSIAHLVCECWHGPRPDGMEVDHIDRNSRNNDYRNLRYVTRSKQMKNRDYTNIAACGSLNLQEHRELISKSVEMKNLKSGEVLYFKSLSSASRYLANYYRKSDADDITKLINKFSYRLGAYRSRILDFDCFYNEQYVIFS